MIQKLLVCQCTVRAALADVPYLLLSPLLFESQGFCPSVTASFNSKADKRRAGEINFVLYQKYHNNLHLAIVIACQD